MKRTIGIIGFGEMGKVLTAVFSVGSDVAVFDINPPKNVKARKLEDAASADLVIFCVPPADLETALTSSLPFLKHGAAVLDIASVKEKPSRLMQRLLPPHVSILGTHPMFGPNSLRITSAKNIIFCPVRISCSKLTEVEGVFKTAGFKIFTMSAKKHDLLMARSQLLTHLFAQVAKNLNVQGFSFAPESFKRMLEAFRVADPDEQFLKDMVSANRFAKKTITSVQDEINKYLREF